MFLTFFGKPRWAASEHIQHAMHDAHGHDDHHAAHDAHHGEAHHEGPEEGAGGEPHAHDAGAEDVAHGTAGYHPHESPWTMLVPLVVLSIGAVFAGLVFAPFFIDPEHGAGFWKGSLFFNEHLMHSGHGVPELVKLSATIVMILGFLVALWAYVIDRKLPARVVEAAPGLYKFLLNKWYFDQLYDLIFVRPAFGLGRLLWVRGDQKTIDRFGPNGAAALVVASGVAARRLQSGYVYTYALVMLLGLAAAATWAMVG